MTHPLILASVKCFGGAMYAGAFRADRMWDLCTLLSGDEPLLEPSQNLERGRVCLYGDSGKRER